jgi:hypothetical protein
VSVAPEWDEVPREFRGIFGEVSLEVGGRDGGGFLVLANPTLHPNAKTRATLTLTFCLKSKNPEIGNVPGNRYCFAGVHPWG